MVSRSGETPTFSVLKIERILHPQPKPYSPKRPFFSTASGQLLIHREKRAFKLVALGGTFDFLHKGHRQLLAKAFSKGDKVIIGVTSDELVKKMHKSHPVQPYGTRVRELHHFLQARGWEQRFRIAACRSRLDLQNPILTSKHSSSPRTRSAAEDSSTSSENANIYQNWSWFEPGLLGLKTAK